MVHVPARHPRGWDDGAAVTFGSRSELRAAPGRHILRALLAVALAVPPCGVAVAEPRSDATTSTAGGVTAAAGPARFTLSARPQSIASGEAFSFLATAQFPPETESVSMRFQLRHPSGRLIFQRTRNTLEPGGRALSESFTRETADLSLRPGAYPATLETSVRVAGTDHRSVLETSLLVYAGDAPPMPVVYAIRVGGQPLADPQGRFVSDPAQFTRPRDEARAIATWILSDPDARVTLSLSPLLTEEWARIAAGYDLVGPEGVSRFESDSPTSREYGSVLALLKSAIETGRMELAATGYADPNISELTAAGLGADVTAHYDRAASSTFASLEASSSTGTVPAGGCVPSTAVRHLLDAGVRFAILDADCIRSRGASVAPTSYAIGESGLVALVADEAASKAAASADASSLVGHAFERLLEGIPGPLTITAELGPGVGGAEALIRSATSLSAQPWTRTLTAREAAVTPKRTATVDTNGERGTAPRGYWTEVTEARRWSAALRAAIGDSAPEVVTAERDSLIAASSAWAGADSDWVLADRGRSFSDTAVRLAKNILGEVSLTVEPITLAGTAGDLPVTVRNDSGRPLAVRLIAEASGGAAITGSREQTLTLEPQDNFVQIPVDLTNAVAGDIRVSVVAADVELASESVTVRASYLDRIALIGGIVLVMIGVLVFVIRRVRAGEQEDGVVAADAGYTGPRTHRSPRPAPPVGASTSEEGPE